MVDYAVCFRCNSLIYRGRANGRAWSHVDYRQERDHRPVPVSQAAEIKLRAERRAGEMLSEAARKPGETDKSIISHDVILSVPKLSELGITAMQSSRWQQEAEKKKIFDMYLACYTQEEIAAATGLTHKTIDNDLDVLVNLETFPKLPKLSAQFQDEDFTPPMPVLKKVEKSHE